MNQSLELTFHNRYVACETFTLGQATDPIDDFTRDVAVVKRKFQF